METSTVYHVPGRNCCCKAVLSPALTFLFVERAVAEALEGLPRTPYELELCARCARPTRKIRLLSVSSTRSRLHLHSGVLSGNATRFQATVSFLSEAKARGSSE